MTDRSVLKAERVASEQAADVAVRRRRRLIIGIVTAVMLIGAATIVTLITSSGSSTRIVHAAGPSPRVITAQRHVRSLLAGIPESSDNVLGNPRARYTIIEYGDLECSSCDDFAVGPNGTLADGSPGSGIENAIINTYVRTGRAKLVYDALDGATQNGVTPNEFVPQQVAADAAGLQHRAWYFIELFYNEQHAEGTNYVNQSFLDGIARQVPGLDFARWLTDSRSVRLRTQVLSEQARGVTIDGGAALTPTVVVQSRTQGVVASQGIPTMAQIRLAMQTVSS